MHILLKKRQRKPWKEKRAPVSWIEQISRVTHLGSEPLNFHIIYLFIRPVCSVLFFYVPFFILSVFLLALPFYTKSQQQFNFNTHIIISSYLFSVTVNHFVCVHLCTEFAKGLAQDRRSCSACTLMHTKPYEMHVHVI